MTSVLVFFFGKYNDSNDFELDYKDKNKPINNLNNLKQVLIRNFTYFHIYILNILYSLAKKITC